MLFVALFTRRRSRRISLAGFGARLARTHLAVHGGAVVVCARESKKAGEGGERESLGWASKKHRPGSGQCRFDGRQKPISSAEGTDSYSA